MYFSNLLRMERVYYRKLVERRIPQRQTRRRRDLAVRTAPHLKGLILRHAQDEAFCFDA